MQQVEDVKKHDAYNQAYKKLLLSYVDNPKQDIKPLIKKLALYGVKIITTKPESEHITREGAEYDFRFAEVIKDFMSLLTPEEFENLFPITKEYMGHKLGMKDFYYTKKYLQGLNPNVAIGEKMFEFLWEYHNREIAEFTVNLMICMSKLRQLDGQPFLAEEWIKNFRYAHRPKRPEVFSR